MKIEDTILKCGPLIIVAPLLVGYPCLANMPPHDPRLWWACNVSAVVVGIVAFVLTIKTWNE